MAGMKFFEKAVKYLDESAHEMTPLEMVLDAQEYDRPIILFYVGGGFYPMTVAVITWGDKNNPDVSIAASALSEYLCDHWPHYLDADGNIEELSWDVLDVPNSRT